MSVEAISPAETADAVSVLGEAFHEYPVMQYVLGPGTTYRRRLSTLIGFFVSARILRQEPVLGVRDAAGEAVWSELGTAERFAL